MTRLKKNMNNSMKFLVDTTYDGERLDVFLSEKINNFSRSYLKKIIEKDLVKVNNLVTNSPSKNIKTNDSIEVRDFENKTDKLIPKKIKLEIIFEDKDILVIDKPKGMVVHPGAGNLNNTLANALSYKYRDKLSNINGNLRPGIVHRIDKETSGLLVIAKNNIQTILTEGRAQVEIDTQNIMQEILDSYDSGISITQVQTQKADPPKEVIDAFRDVQAAKADKERAQNEAEAYANDVIPRARGEAAQILQQAEAYKREVVALAEGEASRFLAIYNEYRKARTVTQERMYLETMEKVMADINKIIIDKKSGGGVVPYLPLPELKKNAGN